MDEIELRTLVGAAYENGRHDEALSEDIATGYYQSKGCIYEADKLFDALRSHGPEELPRGECNILCLMGNGAIMHVCEVTHTCVVFHEGNNIKQDRTLRAFVDKWWPVSSLLGV